MCIIEIDGSTLAAAAAENGARTSVCSGGCEQSLTYIGRTGAGSRAQVKPLLLARSLASLTLIQITMFLGGARPAINGRSLAELRVLLLRVKSCD